MRQVTLTTNGLLLDARTMDELKDIGIDGINFSIDTLDSKKYASICGKDTLVYSIKKKSSLWCFCWTQYKNQHSRRTQLFTQSDLERLD